MLSAKEFEQIAHQAADEASEKAVRHVFALLGVDIDKPHEVESFREDLRFGSRLRKAADHSFLAIVGAVTLLLVGAVGVGLKRVIIGG